MKQKTEIEIEVSETIMYSRPNERFETYCMVCETMVEMATPHVAAVITRSTERAIFRYVETGAIHFIESESLLICMRSLSKKLFESEAPAVLDFRSNRN